MKNLFLFLFVITTLFCARSQTYYTSTVQIVNQPPCTLCCNGSISVSITSSVCPGGPVVVGLMSPSTGTVVQWNSPMINLCNGTYTVVVYSITGPQCDISIVCTPLYPLTTDIKEKKGTGFTQISLFPNPASDLLSVNFNTENNFEKIQIVNCIGGVIMEQKLDLRNKTLSINTNDLPSGIYILKFFNLDESNFVYKRFIIKK